MRRRLIWLMLSFALLSSLPVFAGYQRILSTSARLVVIVVTCPEGEIDCLDVHYVGIDKSSGVVTQIKGADWVRRCAGQDMPCQHIGFKFLTGDVSYYITDDGVLTIQPVNGIHSVSEHGKWVEITE